MLGIIPLSGLPLVFISHGGTALVIALLEAGILLNISRYQKS
jgi:cell division protein FtsW